MLKDVRDESWKLEQVLNEIVMDGERTWWWDEEREC